MSDSTSGIAPRQGTDEYLFYKSKLFTDTLHLDTEFEQIAVFMQEVTEQAATSAALEKSAKVALIEVTARAASELREQVLPSGKARSESQINSEVVLSPEVQAAQDTMAGISFDNDLWQGLVSSFRSKGSAMKSAAELVTVGYVTRDHLDNARRQEIRQASAKINAHPVVGQ
jgi:hypothetical protein